MGLSTASAAKVRFKRAMQQRCASGGSRDMAETVLARSITAKFPVETIEVFFSYGTARLLIHRHIPRQSSSMSSGPSEGRSPIWIDGVEQGV